MKTRREVKDKITGLKSTATATVVGTMVCAMFGMTACSSSDSNDPPIADNNEALQPIVANDESNAPVVCGTDSVYLNDENITVTLGDNTEGGLNNTSSLQNVIDADTAASEELHSQTTHVWHTGEQLELLFDFQESYCVNTVHFWNYNGEGYDVDNVEITFFDIANEITGAVSFDPALGVFGDITAEDIAVDPLVAARFATAIIKGSNEQSDFQNIGFTATRLIPQ